MQNRKRDTDVQNRLLDSVGEGEGWMFRETALKQVYYQGWNRSPAQVGCMRQVLRAGALWRPRGIGWRGRWEGGSGWGIHVNPWLIHVNVWQKPLQYCKVISLQLIKINGEKKKQTIKKKMKRPWCWERLRAGGEGDDRGWDGWMASPTRWTWVWVNSGSWWWTGRPGVLQFMGSERVGHDWVTELN